MMRIVKIVLVSIFVLAIALVAIYSYISYSSDKYIYSDVASVPPKKAALVLGTTKYIAKGRKNYYYLYRIRTAAKLWKSGKIKAIVVSGDNGTRYYNETDAMYNDLIKAGVPAKYITRDYAGFRTLDSIVRAGLDFGLSDYIIITQRFHLQRALFIAHAKGHQAIGLTAGSKESTKAMWSMRLRELFARAKAVLDLYVLGNMPKYYGGKEKVRYRK